MGRGSAGFGVRAFWAEGFRVQGLRVLGPFAIRVGALGAPKPEAPIRRLQHALPLCTSPHSAILPMPGFKV